MYVSDARTPMPSLYTKALPCLSDNMYVPYSLVLVSFSLASVSQLVLLLQAFVGPLT